MRRSRSKATRSSSTRATAAIVCADSAKNMSYELLRINLLVSGKNTRGENGLPRGHARSVLGTAAHGVPQAGGRRVRREGRCDPPRSGPCALETGGAAGQQIKQALEPEEKQIPIGEQERAAAMELLRDPRLLDRILSRLRTLRRGGRGDQQTGELSGGDFAAAWMRRWRSWCSPVPQRANRR